VLPSSFVDVERKSESNGMISWSWIVYKFAQVTLSPLIFLRRCFNKMEVNERGGRINGGLWDDRWHRSTSSQKIKRKKV
jgi:hypothetical protein